MWERVGGGSLRRRRRRNEIKVAGIRFLGGG
jgi:hypothetical protein